MPKILTEITPLTDADCFYIVDRYKKQFDFPMHRHLEYEINFIKGCAGARRVVGDSIEVLPDFDLAIIGPGLEHTWEQHLCNFEDKREITIQFNPTLLSPEFLDRTSMHPIRDLLFEARQGVAFGTDAILSLYNELDEIARKPNGFESILSMLRILNRLALISDRKALSSTTFARAEESSNSRRISKVEKAISENFREELTLNGLAEIAGMSPSSFSRFFKKSTGKTLSEYIIDIRLGHAARELADSTKTVAEICYESGFNNVSNFNRAFKSHRGCTPKDFRDNYRKHKVII